MKLRLLELTCVHSFLLDKAKSDADDVMCRSVKPLVRVSDSPSFEIWDVRCTVPNAPKRILAHGNVTGLFLPPRSSVQVAPTLPPIMLKVP